MIISNKYKFIFIHLNKCGGSSIKKSLSNLESFREHTAGVLVSQDFEKILSYPYIRGHSKYRELFNFFEKNKIDINQYKIISCVRNPYEKQKSEYFWIKNYRETHHDYKIISSKSFKEYLIWLRDDVMSRLNEVEDLNRCKIPVYCTMSDFLKGPDGKVKADHLIKIESMQEDLDFVTEVLGVKKIKMPHVNKNTKGKENVFLDQETLDIFNKMYKEDFDNFGYEIITDINKINI